MVSLCDFEKSKDLFDASVCEMSRLGTLYDFTCNAIYFLSKHRLYPRIRATVRRTTEEINDVKASLSYFVAVSIERASSVCSGGGNVASGAG